MKINVCLASDDNYSKPLGVTIASILRNASEEDVLNFYILSNKISAKSKSKLEKLKKIKDCYLNFIELDEEEFREFPVFDNHITLTMYYRYKIASLLPNEDKILYLDSDVLVKKSLAELYSKNIDQYLIAGVEDIGYTYYRKFSPDFHQFFYINSGVLLLNLGKWREENIEKLLFDTTINKRSKITQGDQDVINMVCHEKCLPLDYRWNVQDSFFRPFPEVDDHVNKSEIILAAKDPFVIHFTGPKKPWKEFLDMKLSSEYLDYLYLTPWKSFFSKDIYLLGLFIKMLVKYFYRRPFCLLKFEYWKTLKQKIKKNLGDVEYS